MHRILNGAVARLGLVLFSVMIQVTGCAPGPRDEVIAGATVPIPKGMSKAKDQRVELALPGFGGEQVSYRGGVNPDEIIAFYKKEMPARGWKPNVSLVTRGGLLAYTKDNKSVLITVSKSGSDTTLTVTVAATSP